ncbi:MAG: nicotinate-nicotinamide nucleotide adenylyltransferase [Patescibacteria group bacterium]|nr:nicotinate-nicotinamide nucleotide adenylyltransferase [Patescibacteria group bacterium]
MNQETIAIYGGSFDPPHNGHLAAVKAVSALPFVRDLVIIPCGIRPEPQKGKHRASPQQRKIMCHLTFGGAPKIRLNFSDILREDFTRTWDLQERFSLLGHISHVVGTDLIKGGAQSESEIQTSWYRGKELWQKLNFLVISRADYEIEKKDLPPHATCLPLNIYGSSTEIRNLCAAGKPITGLVTPEVEKYIKQQNLYQRKGKK